MGIPKDTLKVDYPHSLMHRDEFVGEFRERTVSLSRDRPPSLIQKILNQTTRKEEFV